MLIYLWQLFGLLVGAVLFVKISVLAALWCFYDRRCLPSNMTELIQFIIPRVLR